MTDCMTAFPDFSLKVSFYDFISVRQEDKIRYYQMITLKKIFIRITKVLLSFRLTQFNALIYFSVGINLQFSCSIHFIYQEMSVMFIYKIRLVDTMHNMNVLWMISYKEITEITS
jgi:hypothetical protein